MENLASQRRLQNKVNTFFGEHPETKEHKPFREFSEESSRELANLLQKFDKAGKEDIYHALQLAMDLIYTEKVNPVLVKWALGIFLTHSDLAHSMGITAPSLKFHSRFESDKKPPLSNPVTADTMTGVNILSYFREDYDFNDHHWHWHLVYPYSGIIKNGKHQRVIDRQGELFLYMHSQMIARYNAELLSWDLNMTHAWGYDDVLTYGYTPVPGLRDKYGARPPWQGWYENHSPHLSESEAPPKKEVLIKWRNNIFRAIEEGHFVTKKADGSYGKLLLTAENAMNWVGIVVESENSQLQEIAPGSGEFIFRDLYGSLHNYGHDKFAEIGYHEYTSDKNPLGVMTSNIGSPRDPCFWLWHTHIDDFHQVVVKKFVHNLDEFQPEAKIKTLKVVPRDETSKTPPGGIATFLGPPRLDYNECNAKLDHEPYQWELTVASTRNPPPDQDTPQVFTIRLFIAPTVLIQDQRAWIEMDKFTYKLCKVEDEIIRKDVESSVARKLRTVTTMNHSSRCLCGWPPNMMLPIGKPGGMEYVAFAMLTDDQLGQNMTQSLSFCGAQDDKYPDPRGMGYPFDKTWARRLDSTTSVRDIIEKVLPHTKLYDFKIYRYTNLYQGSTSDNGDPDNITWENTIKNFFTQRDYECMKWKFDLRKHDSVALHAGEIYDAVEKGVMPKGEAHWSREKVDTFKKWKEAGCP